MAALSATTRRIFRFREGSKSARSIAARSPQNSHLRAAGCGLSAALGPVAAARDHLLNPARAVGVADRRGQQAGDELDPLGIGVGRPCRRIRRPLRRSQLVAGGVEGGPQRVTAGREVAAAAEARLERSAEVLPQELAQILVHDRDSTAGETTPGAVRHALELLVL